MDIFIENEKDFPDELKEAILVYQNLLSSIMDYQMMLEKFYSILNTEDFDKTSKFRKLFYLLFKARKIVGNYKIDENIESYYKDIQNSKLENIFIGTTNYTNLIKTETQINTENIFYLNGNVDEYLDLENHILKVFSKDKNGAIEKPDTKYLPFIFTQTTIKPIVNIDIMKRYVGLYNYFLECDVIGIVGYGFNNDDILIKSFFSSLKMQFEKNHKKIIFFNYYENSEDSKKLKYCTEIKTIDNDRKEIKSKKNWLDFLIKDL